ncbi:MAG: hypothetical protein HYX48_06185 [Chlamydiales bacterium]|nr:hypothetical protein [Chlamydiales bacterium]
MAFALNNEFYRQNPVAVHAAVGTLVGAATTSLFTSVAVIPGAIFGATFYFVQILTDIALQGHLRDSPVLRAIRVALPLLAAIFAAVAVVALLGFKLSLQVGAGFSLAMIVSYVGLGLLAEFYQQNCV